MAHISLLAGSMANKQRTTAKRSSSPGSQYRKIQQRVDRRDAAKHGREGNEKKAKPVQTGGRRHPTPPLPKQHQPKPGLEATLSPPPQYEAPTYKGSEKLLDMVALITGGDSGIGRAVAVLYGREGADVAIVYLSDEQQDAEETQQAVEREGRKCLLIPGDVSDAAFCRKAVDRTVREFGRLDILVNNAAFQEHADALEELSDAHFDRTR